ncbi:hypothetical protein TSO221_03270 [Azospirillum sp. TSO22-1]|nr:hypothetical protein TSO221_03270 [Azospirillum sp. TSO22-1]
MPEGPVIGDRIAAALNAARANMHHHRYYAAMQEFRLAEQLIPESVGDAPVPRPRPPARLQSATAPMLRRLILTGAVMRLARHVPSRQALSDSRPRLGTAPHAAVRRKRSRKIDKLRAAPRVIIATNNTPPA